MEIYNNFLIDIRKYTSNYQWAKNSRPNMKTRGYVDYLRITGILVSVTIILASSSAYNLNDNADRSYSWTKTADGQEQGLEEQETASMKIV